MKLIVSGGSLRDPREISLHGRRRFGRAQATSYIRKIEHCCDALSTGRLRGRPAVHVSSGLRKQRVDSAFIFFLIEGDDLIIVRILHEEMNHEDYI
ncbi:MAG: type II toxin-antitoxin system RelE/ParE family toxin [Rhizobiaceae bacterium]|nr:type II toxin-antitoxin system RelE/ParE family toxin [Rhizobiaceae bacterium]